MQSIYNIQNGGSTRVGDYVYKKDVRNTLTDLNNICAKMANIRLIILEQPGLPQEPAPQPEPKRSSPGTGISLLNNLLLNLPATNVWDAISSHRSKQVEHHEHHYYHVEPRPSSRRNKEAEESQEKAEHQKPQSTNIHPAVTVIGFIGGVILGGIAADKSGALAAIFQKDESDLNKFNRNVTQLEIKYNTSVQGYDEISSVISDTRDFLQTEKNAKLRKLVAYVTIAVSSLLFAGALVANAAPVALVAASVVALAAAYLIYRSSYDTAAQPQRVEDATELARRYHDLINKQWQNKDGFIEETSGMHSAAPTRQAGVSSASQMLDAHDQAAAAADLSSQMTCDGLDHVNAQPGAPVLVQPAPSAPSAPSNQQVIEGRPEGGTEVEGELQVEGA